MDEAEAIAQFTRAQVTTAVTTTQADAWLDDQSEELESTEPLTHDFKPWIEYLEDLIANYRPTEPAK